MSDDGLPVGVQLVGHWHDDETVLHVARQMEQANPWHHRYRGMVDRLTSGGSGPA